MSASFLHDQAVVVVVVVVVVNVNLNQHVTFSQGKEDSSTVATQSRLTSEEDITTTAWNRNPDAISSANDILKMHCQGLPLCTVRTIDRSIDRSLALSTRQNSSTMFDYVGNLVDGTR